MTVKIGSNVHSLKAQRSLEEATSQLSSVYEKLSSGQRINKASDDAASLAIADSLRANSRVFNQAVRNLNDGISVVSIADGAISQLSNLTTRILELAEQAANGTYSAIQRAALDKEAQALSDEYSRIIQSTEFNGIKILDGDYANGLILQGGFGTQGILSGSLGATKGSGQFEVASNSVIIGLNSSLVDINGDGFIDIVSQTLVRFGDGTGAFGAAISAGNVGTGTQVVDLNSDGFLDRIGSSGVTLGNGDGTFGQIVSLGFVITNAYETSTGDFNGDGKLDLVVGTYDSGGYSQSLLIFSGNGDGTFALSQTLGTSLTPGPAAFVTGDFNSDGIDDIATTGDSYRNIFLGSRSNGMTQAGTHQLNFGNDSDIISFDANGDGHLDIVGGGGGTNITIALGNGLGGFGTPSQITGATVNGRASLVYGDFNHDGRIDFASGGTSDFEDGINIFLNQGDGTFSGTALQNSSLLFSFSIKAGDINGDGVVDILAYGSDGITNKTELLTGSNVEGTGLLLDFSLKTRSGALQTITLMNQKIQQLASQRSTIGAFESRLSIASSNLRSQSEQMQAAESRIRDIDVAQASSELTRKQILQQLAASVLSQTNLQPQIALSLLAS